MYFIKFISPLMRCVIMSLEWLGGLTWGDSSFSLIIRKSPNHKLGFRMVIKITWSQYGIAHTAGFWDADGSFVLKIAKDEAYNLDYAMSPQVKATTFDNTIIACISEIFDRHELQYSISEQTSRKRKYLSVCITHLPSVRKICELLLPHLIGKKRIQCEFFLKEIIPRLEKGEHLTKKGFIKLAELREMIAFSKKGARKKYHSSYFKELWNLEA